MTLIEDARRLAATEPSMIVSKYGDSFSQCFACRRMVDDGEPHTSDCPWLALPKIMAALEVAEQTLPAFLGGFYLDDDGNPTVWACENCGGTGRTRECVEHGPKCRIGKMQAALRGEAATA